MSRIIWSIVFKHQPELSERIPFVSSVSLLMPVVQFVTYTCRQKHRFSVSVCCYSGSDCLFLLDSDMDPVHGCDAMKYIQRGTEQNRMVDLCILNLKFFSPNCTEMKYKLIKTQKMANLQEHNVTALFVLENRGDRLDLST